MESKSLSLREFNKKALKKRAHLNLEKIYQNDNYLIQTLKRTKRVTIENPVIKFENNLEKLLKKIYKEIKLLKDPIINEINSENNAFKSNYTYLLNNFQNNTSKTFHPLIHLYRNKGYKIPSLNYNHNLFKVNPLIEENTNKIMHYFLGQKTVKTKKEILLIKSLVFLQKLNKIINKKINKNKKFDRRNSADILKPINQDENIENLKNNIQSIMNLINNLSSLDENESFNNNKQLNYDSKIKNLNLNNIKKFENSSRTIDIYSPRNTDTNFFPPSLSNRNEKYRKSLGLMTHGNNFHLDKSYILHNINNSKKNVSDKQIKRVKKLANKNNSFNIKIHTNKINNKYLSSERNKLIHELLHKNKNEGRNKSLNLHSNKYSKTVSNLNKYEKNNRENLPLFIRTQANNENKNINYLNQKKYNMHLNKIYSSSSPFLNKNEFFNFIYKRLKKGNFNDVDKYVKKYLNEIECKNNEETNTIISKYDYKNIKNNLKELEKNIKKSEVDKKTEKIYLNNFISRRVVDSLENMRKKDFQIFKFNKIITALGNSSK